MDPPVSVPVAATAILAATAAAVASAVITARRGGDSTVNGAAEPSAVNDIIEQKVHLDRTQSKKYKVERSYQEDVRSI